MTERTKILKMLAVSEDVFNSVLERYADYVKFVSHDELEELYKGYSDAKHIYYDGDEYLICLEYRLTPKADTDWKQVIVRKNNSFKPGTIESDITGTTAWIKFNKMLADYYTPAEIKQCLLAHRAKANDELAQVHYEIRSLDYFTVYKFKDVVKYDINGAHNDALCEIFPKAEARIRKMYEQRKEKPLNKAIVNYYCGMLKHKGYVETYNWIIQRTTRILNAGMKEVGGRLLYANTDGFMVMHPEHRMQNSKELGKFKVEYEGEAYIVMTNNYLLYQTGDEMFGRAMLEVRDQIDLRHGEYVTYDRRLVGNVYRACNVKEVQMDPVDYEEAFHLKGR